jgi:hypothetical protein
LPEFNSTTESNPKKSPPDKILHPQQLTISQGRLPGAGAPQHNYSSIRSIFQNSQVASIDKARVKNVGVSFGVRCADGVKACELESGLRTRHGSAKPCGLNFPSPEISLMEILISMEAGF